MLPNSLRIILLILTLVSFLPQLRLIWTRKDASGIALSYVLFNLIAATEQFAVDYGFAALVSPSDGVFVHNPVNFGDWLNLAQTVFLWMLFLVYFTLCLYFPSDSNFTHKRLMLGIYIAYLLIAIIPLFLCAFLLRLDHSETAWREWPVVIAFTPHTLWLSYIGTILALVAVYRQARVILQDDPSASPSLPVGLSQGQLDPQNTSLSLLGLAIQSLLFCVLAIAWVFRVSFPALPDGASWWNFSIVKVWYEWVGSVAVDNAIFGIGQGILLLLLLWRERRSGGETHLGTEREPLLRRGM
ncbi:hypothetical protein BJX61DRAFT_510353 [Aspergillus egyptiacus]|nr:hypothetical protein BJX61DRAFT_510353 [Aspergillus egyptiacus]